MLQYGDNNVYVGILKLRLNNIRTGLIVNGAPCSWGVSTGGNLFDIVLWLNVGAFQQQYGLTVDHIYGPATNAKMQQLEFLLGIHY